MLSKSLLETTLNTLVSLKDTDGPLTLWNTASSMDTNIPDPLVRACHGLVYAGDQLLVRTFPHNLHFTVPASEAPSNAQDPTDPMLLIEDYFVTYGHTITAAYDSYDGTLLRVFHYVGKWYVATHNKLDAFQSKWNSKTSFGAQFVDALTREYAGSNRFRTWLKSDAFSIDAFFAALDTKYCYTFLVRASDDKPSVSYSGSFLLGPFESDSVESDMRRAVFLKVPVATPATRQFANIDKLLQYVQNIDLVGNPGLQGVLMYTKSGDVTKLLNAQYAYTMELRGNEPDPVIRYLQLRMDNRKREALYDVYPGDADKFDTCENQVYKMAVALKDAYIQRYVKTGGAANSTTGGGERKPQQQRTVDFPKLPGSLYQFLRRCHQWHCEDRKANRVTLTHTIDFINAMPWKDVLRMLRDSNTTGTEEGSIPCPIEEAGTEVEVSEES